MSPPAAQAKDLPPETLKPVLEDVILDEIRRLASEADAVIFVHYDHAGTLLDYRCHNRDDDGTAIAISPHFRFEGIGAWYIANRRGDTFAVRKVLLHIENGRFAQGQIGQFEGFWDEFPRYVAEDRWVQSVLGRKPANDHGARPD